MQFPMLRSCIFTVIMMAAFLLSCVETSASSKCSELPSESDLQSALESKSSSSNARMWVMVAANDGSICVEAFIGGNPSESQQVAGRNISLRTTVELDEANSGEDLVDKKIGGIDAFADGLSLFDANGKRLGHIIVLRSKTSCRHRTIVQQTRHNLGLDLVELGIRC